VQRRRGRRGCWVEAGCWGEATKHEVGHEESSGKRKRRSGRWGYRLGGIKWENLFLVCGGWDGPNVLG